ncbi:MAG: SCP2 sterol-binding domain-containing protein [Solirubrobacteraceae bacterium]
MSTNAEPSPRFLSDEWCAAANERLNEDEDTKELAGWANLTMHYVVTDVPTEGRVAYYRRFADDEVVIARGTPDEVTLTLTLPYEVAAEVNRGAIDIPSAFAQKKLTVDGELGPLMMLREELSAVTTLIAEVPTTY